MPESQPDIAIFLRSLANGGAEKLMVNLANNFTQRGLKTDLVLTRTDGAYMSKVSSDVNIVDLKSPKLPVSLPKLVGYLRQKQPATLLTALHYPCEIALWAKRLAGVSTRVVVSEHNTLSVEAKRLPQLSARLSPIAAKLFYSWADGIVAVSQGAAEDLAKVTGLPLTRIQTIYNPVITPEMLSMAKEPIDNIWFAPGEPPVVLGVGRLREQKDFPTLIKAFAKVRQVKAARLIILGSGPDLAKLKALIAELGLEDDVAFPGFCQNPYAYMAKTNVFVLSSAWEGLSNVLIEALGTGAPVVSTNCPSGPAEVLDNGKYGELVPVGDSEAMAEAILRVLSGEIKSVDPSWLEQFTLETVSQQYLDVLGVSV